MAASEVDFVLVDSRPMLRDCFGLLDEGVEAILARCPSERFNSADVYTAVINGACELRLARVDLDIAGFIVTYKNVDLVGRGTLFVWLLYLTPGIPDTMGEIVAELELMAKEQGCQAIEFCTTRPAWERRLQTHGFVPKAILLSKEVV